MDFLHSLSPEVSAALGVLAYFLLQLLGAKVFPANPKTPLGKFAREVFDMVLVNFGNNGNARR